MRTGYALRLLPLALALVHDRAGADAQKQYVLKEKFVGRDFLDAWTWETMDDPTHGRVNYVDQRTALQKNLSYGTPPPPASPRHAPASDSDLAAQVAKLAAAVDAQGALLRALLEQRDAGAQHAAGPSARREKAS